ncbi:MAG: MurT ligase domain-containing protein [Actinomycetota bacterium]
MLRLVVATALARLAGRLSRLLGRGGSALPGLIAEKIDPRTIERLVGPVRRGVIVVTGTNGKTTTTRMLVGMLEAEGLKVVTNPTGSNLARGIATRLIEVASWRGRVDADVAVFEVDEAAVRPLAPRLRPRVMVVTNMARDQLDRFGELSTTASHAAAAVRHTGVAVLNADDPLVAEMAVGAAAARFFGAAEPIRRAMPHDSSLYGVSEAEDLRTTPDLLLERADPAGDDQVIELAAASGERATVRLQLPGPYNGYNAAAAVLAAAELGVPLERAVAALGRTRPAFGRGQVVDYRGRRVKLLLVKNPAGFNQAIRLLTALPPGAPVLLAINDLEADGRDVSWLWDARVEDLAGTGHRFGTAGLRAYDMALRLKYAGLDAWSETDFAAALERFVEGVAEAETGYLVPTYTAMLRFLDLLRPGTSKREAWS